MLSTLLRTIRERQLLSPGDRVLVGLSGGADSTALLLALHGLASRLRIEVEAATIDHGLRADSAAEAAEVGERCRGWAIPWTGARVDVAAARTSHVSWQDAARRARLSALDRIAGERGCSRIALAHTADDQAETVLFRIVRGTGVAGLAGIPYRRGAFVRPLLDVRRAQVVSFVTKRQVRWIEDPSNADRRFARTRVRHELLPLLARENPRVVEALLALAEDAARRTAGDRSAVPHRLASTVRRLAVRGGTSFLDIAGGRLQVSYGQLSFTAKDASVSPVTSESVVSGPGVYRVSEEGPVLEIREVNVGKADAGAALFDADAVPWPWHVRPPRPGDRMRPRGGRGSRKLQDLLVDAKIPRARRPTLPVVVSGQGTILFVPGLRPAEAGQPATESRRLVQVSVL